MIRRIANVDEARARVLVMKARAEGHFSTGGRGNNAPDMGPTDAASALLLSIQMEGPNEAPNEITRLRDLPFFTVKHDPGDGTYRDLDLDFVDPDGNCLSEIMPETFAGSVPLKLGNALGRAFGSGVAFQNRFDRIQLEQWSQGCTVTLSLAEESYTHSAWDEGPKSWKFVFQTEVLGDYEPLCGRKTTTIHGEALRALRDLVKGGS